MRHPTFDLDVLRTFVAGVELGSFAKAAERLGRSTSAVSAQLKKLESQVGSAVLVKSGRGLILSAAGESLLSQARRLLELNDEIFSSLRGAHIEGRVRIGLQDDFAEHLLSDVLRRFSRFHPLVSLEVSIARNAELLAMIENGRLDLALAWETAASTPHATRLGETQMYWIGSRELPTPSPTDNLPLPLVVFDAPCILRSAATNALDRARIPWRVALTSPSVSGIWAAVSAGLGVTLRTRIGLPPELAVIDSLPALPMLGYVLHQAVATPTAAVRQLSELIQAGLAELR
ncbi:LysR substrate-binding domain-containing protein [Pseudomonas sp. MWU13-2105]|uniref:LysR substrate-binding domain-containing protein n=1 Tax=Pseudomonas sp. MWU13-2105 TaxID=2935074 RepID=UPI002010BE18|nr:LysR substrate-binding domain-containing protein [Pseudomonas sp. MWU13-2105]